MKTMQLKTIHLRNFKGAKDVKIDFSQEETTISGDNGTGKTTIFDAFNWLLWGKNSANESTFEIKSLDSENKYIDQQEHEVNGVIDIDGMEATFKRVYKEKWTKRRGSEISELTGHDTDLYINDVPKTKTEYDLEISKLINPQIARLITDPLFFNTILKWNERREILTDMAGGISDNLVIELIATPGNDLGNIIEILNSGKSLSDKKKEIAVKKKLLKDDLTQIPSRIDEVERSKPLSKDWGQLSKDLVVKTADLAIVNNQIENIQQAHQEKYNEIAKIDARRFELMSNIEAEKRSITSELNKDREEVVKSKLKAENDIRSLNQVLITNKQYLAYNNTDIEDKRKQVINLRESWKELNAKPILNNQTLDENCPTCSAKLPEDQLESKRSEIISKAKQNVKNQLDEYVRVAEKINKEIENLIKVSAEYQSLIDETEKQLVISKELLIAIIPFEMPFKASELLLSFELELENTPKKVLEPANFGELNNQKESIEAEINMIKDELKTKDQIDLAEKRILQLTSEQKTLSQELASLEQIEIQIDLFNKTKIDMVESRVNGLFELVKFKMYDQQINGGENPSCVCMVNGVPFSDLNTASKINAGIDIINAIQKYFEISAPIFIDNRESISEILQTKCQIINLVKVKGLDKLTVE